MQGLMMDFPLTLDYLLKRAEALSSKTEIVTRLPDKGWHRYTYGDMARRAKRLALALRKLGIRPSGAAQRGGGPVLRAAESHGLAGLFQLHHERTDFAAHRAFDPAGQPAGQDVQCRFVSQPRDDRTGDGFIRRLVQGRCQQRAPVGDATPGQIGVTLGVSGQPAAQRRQRVSRPICQGEPRCAQLLPPS